jgi:hypothetical protein
MKEKADEMIDSLIIVVRTMHENQIKTHSVKRITSRLEFIESTRDHLQNRKTAASALQNRQPRQLIISSCQS